MKNAIIRYFIERAIDFYLSGIDDLHARWLKTLDD